LLINQQEVLVGGAGLGCYYTQPGGVVNFVTRRSLDKDAPKMRAIFRADEYGTLGIKLDHGMVVNDALSIRLGLDKDLARNAAKNLDDNHNYAANIDYQLSPTNPESIYQRIGKINAKVAVCGNVYFIGYAAANGGV
jgi:outer membrane receptor protein involved in Fe transport